MKSSQGGKKEEAFPSVTVKTNPRLINLFAHSLCPVIEQILKVPAETSPIRGLWDSTVNKSGTLSILMELVVWSREVYTPDDKPVNKNAKILPKMSKTLLGSAQCCGGEEK